MLARPNAELYMEIWVNSASSKVASIIHVFPAEYNILYYRSHYDKDDRQSMVKHGMVKHGMVKHGMVKHSMVKHGMVKHGKAWHGECVKI